MPRWNSRFSKPCQLRENLHPFGAKLVAILAGNAGLCLALSLWIALLVAQLFLTISIELKALVSVGLLLVSGAIVGLNLSRLERLEASSDGRDSKPNLSAALLAVIILLGLALRCWHVDFGFPNFYHPDEGPKGRIVAKMLTSSSLNPHYFLHPTLLLYLSALVTTFIRWFDSSVDLVEQSVLGGRLVSVFAGTVSIWLVAKIGQRLIAREAGLVAALSLAVSPLHITCSRYMKEDVLFLTFVLGTLLAAVSSLPGTEAKTGTEAKRGFRISWLLAAGFLAGCAAGSKYTGVLAASLIVLVPLVIEGRIRWRATAWALILVPIGFLLCTPYALLDSEAFLKHFLVEQQHMKSGHQGVAIDAWSQLWMYHFTRSLIPGFGCGVVFAVLGVGILFSSSLGGRSVVPRLVAKAGVLLLILLLMFYLPAEWVKAKPPPQAERYVLGAVPFLSLALGGLVWRFAKFSGPLTVVIMVLSIVLPAVRSIELADNLVPDTRRQAREWLVANLPPETKILIEASYSPRLRETNFQVRLAKLANHPERFTVTELGQVPEDYLLVNSFSYQRYFSEPKANPLLKKRWSRMFESFPLVAEFQSPEGRYGFHNPTIRLYRIGTERIEIGEQVQSNAPLPELDKTGDGSIQEGPTEEQLGSE